MAWNPSVVSGIGVPADMGEVYRDMHAYLSAAGASLLLCCSFAASAADCPCQSASVPCSALGLLACTHSPAAHEGKHCRLHCLQVGIKVHCEARTWLEHSRSSTRPG